MLAPSAKRATPVWFSHRRKHYDKRKLIIMHDEEIVKEETATQPAKNETGEGELAYFSTYAKERAEAKWYALHTFSGFEHAVEKNLRTVIEKTGEKLQKRIFDIIIPVEDVIEEKKGKRTIVQHKVMPGYVFVKLIYGDDIWHAVTGTRGITGFVGPEGRAQALGDDEVARMRLEKIKIDVSIKVGDKIEILDGPLTGQAGEVVEFDKQTGKIRANVSMFGRAMTVDVELSQIRKI